MTDSTSIRSLSADQWRKRLQDHYLSKNGAYSGQSLHWLNATPEELALAVGFPEASQEDVLEAFMNLFSRKGVRRVFAHKVAIYQGRFAYDNFHYLVLSCFVTATPLGAGENRDFRDRLGELLQDGQGREQGVSGLNSLWEALAQWVSTDSSLRQISLPNPDSYRKIGIALKLAYPSWEDLAALSKILKKASKDIQNRYALLQHIRSHQYDLPPSSKNRIAAHIEELGDRFTHGQAVETHSFWRIIERVLGDLQNTGDSSSAALLWRLSLDFYGADESGVDVLIAKGNRREQLSKPCWEGNFEELLASPSDSKIPVQVQQLLMIGTILLFECPNGLWSQDDRPMTDVSTIVLTNKKAYIKGFEEPLALSDGWFASEPMAYDQAKSLTFNEGLAIDPKVATCEFSLEGGIQVRKDWWLRRAGYLPYINLPKAAQVETKPDMVVGVENNVAHFDADKIPDGQLRITIHNENFYKSLSLGFLSQADRNTVWPTRQENGFGNAQEVQFDDGNLITDGAMPVSAATHVPRLLDALEAIYARARGRRTERETLNLLKPVLPKNLNPWDLLRSLEEAGWLEQDVSTKWRGRLWRALPPRLVTTSAIVAIVEGATGQVELDLLETEAKKLGIEYCFNAENPWSVPVIGVTGEGLDRLAEALSWPMVQAKQPLLQSAPHCWLPESRTPQGRQFASAWSSETGRFVRQELDSNSQKIELTRYVRADDQDLFCITKQGQPVFSSSERLVALLELARLNAQPLFIQKNDKLVRQAQWGYLPLCLGQWLRRSTAQQTGPMQSDEGFSYGYSVTAAQLKVLRRIFGQAVGDSSPVKKQNFIHTIARDRYRGQRSHWPINREQA